MTSPVIMLDTVDPDRIPATWRGPVAGYVPPSRWAWPPSAFREHRKAGYVKIATRPGMPEQARIARVLDRESEDATDADCLPFLRERRAEGHDDGTIYASLDNWPSIMHAVGEYPLRLWVAWYWGRPGFPSRDLIVHELAVRGVGLAAGQHVWACQYLNDSAADLDHTAVYGRQDFSHG